MTATDIRRQNISLSEKLAAQREDANLLADVLVKAMGALGASCPAHLKTEMLTALQIHNSYMGY